MIKILKNLIIKLSVIIVLTNISWANNMTKQNAYQFSFESIDGNKINLKDYEGKLLLIVNTASKCGFTPQYKGLEELHNKYKDRGLIIIGVPSSDFANQEFSQISEVKEFTDSQFNITFPLTNITKVKGQSAHPFYIWAAREAGFLGSPKWNFHKYLIDKDGNLLQFYSSITKPTSNKIIKKIEENL